MSVDLAKVSQWLRTEAEDIQKEINKKENKIKKIMKDEDLSKLNTIQKYNIELRELRAAQTKLYEMIGRQDELV